MTRIQFILEPSNWWITQYGRGGGGTQRGTQWEGDTMGGGHSIGGSLNGGHLIGGSLNGRGGSLDRGHSIGSHSIVGSLNWDALSLNWGLTQ